jgi:hypothetical protein
VWEGFSRANATPQAVCRKIEFTAMGQGFFTVTIYSPTMTGGKIAVAILPS